jgi:positive phototaxis protein PixI
LNLVSDSQSHQTSVIADPIKRSPQQILSFLLRPNSVVSAVEPFLWGIEIEHVIELVNIPIDRIVPMPHLPPAIVGVHNWRGEILWIVDFAMLLGETRSPQRYRSLQPTIIIASDRNSEAKSDQITTVKQRQTHSIGLIVDRIEEIEWCESLADVLPIPPNIPPERSKWMQISAANELVRNFLVLDAPAILTHANLHADA